MYYSYVEIEYIATSFSPARTDLALKLLKFMKDSPPKNYGKIFGCVKHSLHGMVNWSHHLYSDLFVQIIDSYCKGTG
jgi:hypothetical protein